MIRVLARVRVALMAAIVTAGFALPADADVMPYKITDLGSLPLAPGSGQAWAEADALNNRGQVAGYSNGSAFLYSDGKMTPLAASPNGFNGINDEGQLGTSTNPGYDPRGINSSGETVGSFTKANYGINTVPATEFNGVVTSIPHFGMGLGLNDAGQVVGSIAIPSVALPNGGTNHAFVYSNGTLTDLATSLGENSEANAINNLGQIVGSRGQPGAPATPFLYSNGKFTDLGTFGGLTGTALGINDSGQVIGYTQGLGQISAAFLYQNGVLIDLTKMVKASYGLDIATLAGINNAGQIAFNATIDGQSHAFLLTPSTVPEPSTLFLLGCIPIALVVHRRSTGRGPTEQRIR